jgi:hypothetical protein
VQPVWQDLDKYVKRILYLTDSLGVSQGYEPAFGQLLKASGIYRNQIILADIYKLVKSPLKKYANETTWKFDRDKRDEIQRAFESRVRAVRPDYIVLSDPACLGIFTGWDLRSATLVKQRGSVYEWEGIPVIILYPITALHRTVDSRMVTNEDGEADTVEPYTVKDGAKILAWDWQKVGRIVNGKPRKIPPFRYSICRTREDLEHALAYALDSVLISRDVETALHPPIVTCDGFTGLLRNGACHSFVIPFYDPSKPGNTFWSADDHLFALEVCETINALETPKTMQNGSYDCTYYIRDQIPPKQYVLDSQYMWWARYMELPKRLDFITSVFHDTYRYWKDDSKGDEQESVADNMEGYWRYNALDTYWTLWNTLYLIQLFLLDNAAPFRRNFIDAMYRTYSGLGLSMRGLKVDWKRRDYHRAQLEKEMNAANEEVRYMLGEPDFNVSSSDHKKWLLYQLFGLRERNARGKYLQAGKERKGVNAPSAGKLPMKMAKSEHPLFRLIIEKVEAALEPRVQLSNIFGYTDDTKSFGVRGGLFMPTGRFRSAFNPCGTETTRFSSKKSNLWDGGNAQNIRGKYKDWVIPDDDCIFLDVDFSQSDDIFIGYESQDPAKIEVIESGRDGHAVHGELFFGISYETIVGGRGTDYIDHPITGVRQNSKRIVHGTNFQMAGFTLYVTMGRESVVAAAITAGHLDAESWSEEKLVALCDVFMRKYRTKYPRLTRNGWYAELAAALKRDGALTNCFGITRQFLGNPTDNGTQREATAFIGQSATAGNMNRVLEEIDLGIIEPTFRDGPNPHAREKPLQMNWETHGLTMQLQVHDNFLAGLNLRHPNWREAAANLLTVMDRPVIIHGREVRIRSEAEIGIRWGKGMLKWDGKNPRDIEGIVARLTQKG